MSKAIFTVKSGSGYDDRPEEYYHFPRTYLNQVKSVVGDCIIYYEPRRSDEAALPGRMAYFATARVVEIVPDRNRDDHFYTRISDYLDFDRSVSFLESDRYFESALQKEDGSVNKGAFGRAVRLLPEIEFEMILRAGFAAELDKPEPEQGLLTGFGEQSVPFQRPIIEMTISRPFRDRAFKSAVRHAYENRCALTGLQLINGGGRPEVQAAHIQPVAENGPDTVRNGLALSGTFHWLFDRGLISVADDYRILIADKVPEQARRMLNADGKVIVPKSPLHRPNPHYLKFHRESVFKGERRT